MNLQVGSWSGQLSFVPFLSVSLVIPRQPGKKNDHYLLARLTLTMIRMKNQTDIYGRAKRHCRSHHQITFLNTMQRHIGVVETRWFVMVGR